MPAIRSAADYEECLREILRAAGGRSSRGHVLREFERRFYSSIPREDAEGEPGAAEPRWQRRAEAAARGMASRGLLVTSDHDGWELP